VEVILTEGPAAALAAKNAMAPTPLVFTFVPDPVAVGLVASLARPGGNITGVANISAELSGKRLELLKEAVPSLKAVALLTDPAEPASATILNNTQTAGRRMDLGVRPIEVRHSAELEPSLSAIAREPSIALEREKARQRTYDAMVRKAKALHVTGGKVYGYDNVEILGPDGTRASVARRINVEQAAVVRRIFDLYATGVGMVTIAHRLNEEGVRPPRGRGWAPSCIPAMLYPP